MLIFPLHCTFVLVIFFHELLYLNYFFGVKFYLLDHIFSISMFISPSTSLLFLGLFLSATKRHTLMHKLIVYANGVKNPTITKPHGRYFIPWGKSKWLNLEIRMDSSSAKQNFTQKFESPASKSNTRLTERLMLLLVAFNRRHLKSNRQIMFENCSFPSDQHSQPRFREATITQFATLIVCIL